MFRALQPSEAPGSGAFWPLTRVPAKGGCRLEELNRVGGVHGQISAILLIFLLLAGLALLRKRA